MMRWLVLIGYGVFLALATWVIAHRTDAVKDAIAAKRDLPFNHLIGKEDVSASPWYVEGLAHDGQTSAGLVGKYTTGAVRAGQVLRDRELAAVPTLAAEALLVPVDRQAVLGGRMNAAIRVSLCAGSSQIAKAAVGAVLCSPSPVVGCVAAIEFGRKDLEAALANSKGAALTAQAGDCK
jgi:hypothetical protein